MNGGGGGHEGLKIDRRASRSEMESSKDASAAAGKRECEKQRKRVMATERKSRTNSQRKGECC